MTAAEYIRKLAWSVAHEPDAAEALRACAALVEAACVIRHTARVANWDKSSLGIALAAIEALVPRE